MTKNLLSASGLHKAYGEKTLVSDVSLGIDAGDKIGLIGPNGTGKSTLLGILADKITPDAGEVILRGGTRLGWLEQVPTLNPDRCAREVIEEGLGPLRRAIRDYEHAAAQDAPEAQRLYDEVERLGGWDYDHRVERAAAALRLTDLAAPVAHMSGGERKRTAIARLLVAAPDLILLDEPTNHLDADTVGWLEQWLGSTEAAVLLVTHDRYFLDRVIHRLLELRDAQVRTYHGNYTDYVAARAVEEARRERTRHRRLRSLMAELAWARRAPKARTTKARARLSRIDAAEEEVSRLAKVDKTPSIRFGEAPRLGQTIVELNDVKMGYSDETPLIKGLDFNMRRGERLGVIGPNGCGKSTLLKLLAGRLKPSHGRIVLGKNTKVAVFDQERRVLEGARTVRDVVLPEGGDTVFPGGEPMHVVTWLSRFGFDAREHRSAIATLSGGERNRLALARFLLSEANLLLLDEPTNDLDIPTLNVLEEALVDFKGCLMVVSHDRYFLDKVATGILAFEGHLTTPGQVTLVQGSYTTYRSLRGDALAAAAATLEQPTDEPPPPRATEQPVRKALTYGEEIELQGLEPRIEEAEAAVAEIEAQLADPALWSAGHERGMQLDAELRTAKETLDSLYARWEELMSRLEKSP